MQSKVRRDSRRCRRKAAVAAGNQTIHRHIHKARAKARLRGFPPSGASSVAENPSGPGFVFVSRLIPSRHTQSRNQCRESGILHVSSLVGLHVD